MFCIINNYCVGSALHSFIYLAFTCARILVCHAILMTIDVCDRASMVALVLCVERSEEQMRMQMSTVVIGRWGFSRHLRSSFTQQSRTPLELRKPYAQSLAAEASLSLQTAAVPACNFSSHPVFRLRSPFCSPFSSLGFSMFPTFYTHQFSTILRYEMLERLESTSSYSLIFSVSLKHLGSSSLPTPLYFLFSSLQSHFQPSSVDKQTSRRNLPRTLASRTPQSTSTTGASFYAEG